MCAVLFVLSCPEGAGTVLYCRGPPSAGFESCFARSNSDAMGDVLSPTFNVSHFLHIYRIFTVRHRHRYFSVQNKYSSSVCATATGTFQYRISTVLHCALNFSLVHVFPACAILVL